MARSEGLYDVGGMQWELVASLAVAWLLVYACVFKGVHSSGKVVYFTATAPFVMLAVLLIRGITLPGALDGLTFYMKPDIQKLKDSRVWVEAGTQVLYSFACTFGGMVSLGSYNRFNRDFVRDCKVICFMNAFGSLFGGTVIFAVLGYMSHISGIPIDKVADSGPGLVFIVYPKAVSLMPFPRVWSILFFIMLNLVAVDSCFVMVEAIITALLDWLPVVKRFARSREVFSALACLIMFTCGLPFVTEVRVLIMPR